MYCRSVSVPVWHILYVRETTDLKPQRGLVQDEQERVDGLDILEGRPREGL